MNQSAIHLDMVLAWIGLGPQLRDDLPIDRHVSIQDELLCFATRSNPCSCYDFL